MPETAFPVHAAAGIKLLAMDVDGVLTDGSIMLDDMGVETKRFNVRDGQGIASWLRLGLDAAVITRRAGQALQHRCRELGIRRIMQGAKDKAAALDELVAASGISPAQIAYVGDDWPDLPALKRVGLAVAVADADERVRAAAHFVTSRRGGEGAIREIVERILDAQGLLDRAVSHYS